jgi:MFS transporter, SP family, solute carrier family 2 (myo-inositol transporter), member 13
MIESLLKEPKYTGQMAYTNSSVSRSPSFPANYKLQNMLLLLVAGLGGLLYGIDVGIIGGALPYLEASSQLSAGQLSVIVAAVLLGSVFSTLFAGLLADWMGRKPLMTLSGITFVVSIPIIALSHGYETLFFGRLLQGISGGFIGVVVPLYLAECLASSVRGRGTAIFQWLLTFGIFAAAVIGIYYSYRVQAIEHVVAPEALRAFKDQTWRRIFWVSLPPCVLFVIGTFFVAESPRWYFRRGKLEKARAALMRSRAPEEAEIELREMQETASTAQLASSGTKETLFQRKYIYPFVLACVILFCNTATGINSLIGFNANILMQSGLSDLHAHWGYVFFTMVNFLMTIVGMTLVDKKGRKFLLTVGTSGIIVSMLVVGILFLRTEKRNLDCRAAIQSSVTSGQTLDMRFTPDTAKQLLNSVGATTVDPANTAFAVIYSYGGFTGATTFVRADDPSAEPIHITREVGVPNNKVEGLFTNPFASVDGARTAPLVIERAIIASVPSESHGWLIALLLYTFVAFYASGPGVVVWLALSELMPTRIRSNGMSIALVINQLVSTTLAVIFLPVASKYGYSAMFFLFAGFTVIYFLAAVFFLPETKGKTLEEIEERFARAAAR